MKKIDYIAPEMEVVEMKLDRNLMLITSGDPEFDPTPSDE